jgi:hypothetical protein
MVKTGKEGDKERTTEREARGGLCEEYREE